MKEKRISLIVGASTDVGLIWYGKVVAVYYTGWLVRNYWMLYRQTLYKDTWSIIIFNITLGCAEKKILVIA